MKRIEITIDFETCSLSANAAPMMLAAVPWLRDGEDSPFLKDDDVQPFVGYVDLRSCVVDDYDFDQGTVRWWSCQSDLAKSAVTEGEPKPIDSLLYDFIVWVQDLKMRFPEAELTLWCQGPDVDIAILRNICRKEKRNLEQLIPHTRYRDCRTLVWELLGGYDDVPPMPEEFETSQAHDALYDARRSSWSTWYAFRKLTR